MRWMNSCGIVITGGSVFLNIMTPYVYYLEAKCGKGKCDEVAWLWISVLLVNCLLNMFTFSRIFKNDRKSMLVWIIFQIVLLIAIAVAIKRNVFPEIVELVCYILVGYLIITIPIMTVARWKLRGYTNRPSPTQYNASYRPKTTNRPYTGGGYDFGGGDIGRSYDYGGGDTGGSYDCGGGDTGGSCDYGGGDTGGSYDCGGGDTGGSCDYGGGDTGGGYDCGCNDD